MKVLSLFYGMACGALAMQVAGIEIEKYIAYEVDKYAIQTAQQNFPFIEERGDVFTADFTQYAGFDYLIGGSPCTYWSIAQTKNRETVASGRGWELFSQYVRALHEAKPRFFLYENNKSMSAAIRASITETFGFEPILINSALVSAQNRQRLYWCGIRQSDGTYKKADIQQPADRGILLKDILEINGLTWLQKAYTVTATEGHGSTLQHCLEKHVRTQIAEPICVNSKSGRAGIDGLQPSLQDRIYDTAGKMPAVTTSFNPKIAEPLKVRGTTDVPIYEVKDGFITVKGKQYPIKLVDGFYIIRKLTVPEWYEWPVSKSQAYKILGNGWTVEVIAHLLRGLK